MKLLDIMLKHEIEWPAEAQCAVQDDDGYCWDSEASEMLDVVKKWNELI